MSEAWRRSNPTRDHHSRSRLIVETAAERFDLALANGPATPDWYELVIAQPGHDTVGLATPVKARGTIDRLTSDRNRKGRWTFRRPTHDRLIAADGFYALGVYDETEAVQHLELVPAADVATLLEGSWFETDDCEMAHLSWGRVFDDVDRGRGTIADGSGSLQAVAEPEVAPPVDPRPETEGTAPVELVIDPVNSNTGLVIEVTRHLRKKFDLETSIDREHALVYEVEEGHGGETQ